ncbi:ABC transporter permease subunit [Candidatus Poribacteria bacterium]|nr:ABC transporter permease subunit [Candidatus Poribacteria bacterium]
MPKTNFINTSRTIFSITIRQSIRSKKTFFMLIITFLPVVLAISYRIIGRDMEPNKPFSRLIMIGPENALSMMMMFYLLFLGLLVSLFYGASLIADEVDNKTIIYLFTRPIKKISILAGKFAAYLVQSLLIIIPPILLCLLIIIVNNSMIIDYGILIRSFVGQVGVIVLALVVYGTIFNLLGVWIKRPILFGLLFAFGWEKMLLIVPGSIKKICIAHYLLSAFPRHALLPEQNMQMGFRRGIIHNSSLLTSIIVISIITIIFFIASIMVINRKEYKFE